MRKIWCRIQTINKNQGQKAGHVLCSPLNLATQFLFFLWRRNVLNSFCSELYLGKTFLYMSVLSGVTCLIAHFGLCYRGGAETALLLCSTALLQVTSSWLCLPFATCSDLEQLLHPGKSGREKSAFCPCTLMGIQHFVGFLVSLLASLMGQCHNLPAVWTLCLSGVCILSYFPNFLAPVYVLWTSHFPCWDCTAVTSLCSILLSICLSPCPRCPVFNHNTAFQKH